MKTSHNFFCNLAFNLAEIQLGKTKTNPSVGCVVVKDSSVISSGFTSLNGRPHAEYNTLNKIIDFRGSDLYVTLEPCSHYGVTPPCTNIIKKKNIKNVYYCFDDPDKRSFRQAKTSLNRTKIKVNKIRSQRNFFYESYFINQRKKQPLIDAKIAISKDYFSISKKSKWITNNRSRNVGHLIRSKYDCIISTSTSINRDDSLLNCRINGLNNFKPDLIIVDRKLKLKKNLKLFKLTEKRSTIIVTESKNKKKISFFKKKKIKFIFTSQLKNKKNFDFLIKRLFKLGKRRILVETGLTFLNQLLNMKLINNLYLFRSNFMLKTYGYNNAEVNYIKRYNLNKPINVNLENDKLYKIKIK